MLDSTIHYCAKVESVIHLFIIWVQTTLVWKLITVHVGNYIMEILLVDNIEAQFIDIIVPPILW